MMFGFSLTPPALAALVVLIAAVAAIIIVVVVSEKWVQLLIFGLAAAIAATLTAVLGFGLPWSATILLAIGLIAGIIGTIFVLKHRNP